MGGNPSVAGAVSLSLLDAVAVTLFYYRHNCSQEITGLVVGVRLALVVPITAPVRVTTSRKPRPKSPHSCQLFPLAEALWRRGESNP